MDLSIETTLKTVATELNAQITPNTTFPDLWKKVDQAYAIRYQKSLPLKGEIDKIHHARNSVQHQGLIPSPTDLNQFLGYATRFLDDVFLTFSGLKLNELFLSSIIDNVDICKMMEVAERDVSTDPRSSMVASVKSFEWAKTLSLRNIGFFDPTLGAFDSHDGIGRALQEPVRKIVHSMVERIMELELQVDRRAYVKIRGIAPYAYITVGTTDANTVSVSEADKLNYNEGNAWLCYGFALEMILRWQERGLL